MIHDDSDFNSRVVQPENTCIITGERIWKLELSQRKQGREERKGISLLVKQDKEVFLQSKDTCLKPEPDNAHSPTWFPCGTDLQCNIVACRACA